MEATNSGWEERRKTVRKKWSQEGQSSNRREGKREERNRAAEAMKAMTTLTTTCNACSPVWWVSPARWWTIPPVSPSTTLVAAPLLARVWGETEGVFTILPDNLLRRRAVDLGVNHLLKYRACLGDVKVGCRGRGKQGAHQLTLLLANTFHASHQRHLYPTRRLVF